MPSEKLTAIYYPDSYIEDHRSLAAYTVYFDELHLVSFVRGEQEQWSDIDLLADILRPISLLEMVGAEIYLSEALGIKVDLVPKRSVREELRDNILEEMVNI